MKNSATKIVRSLLNKKNVNKLIKYITRKTLATSILSFFFIILLYLFIKPYFFDYETNIKFLEKRINDKFKINSKIIGKISYEIFPSPRLKIKNFKFNLMSEKNDINLDEVNIKIPIFNNKNLSDMVLKNIIIKREEIEIFPEDLQNYINYFSLKNKRGIIFKNCTLYFLDDQKNKVIFKNFNFIEKFRENEHLININTIFSNNKIKVAFKDIKNQKKKLDIKIPKINSNINFVFDSSSSLKNIKGKSKIKIFENIFLLNFEGMENLKISESFLRSKFVNTKINGNISFIDNLIFDINLNINQIKFRKLLLYYFPEKKVYFL